MTSFRPSAISQRWPLSLCRTVLGRGKIRKILWVTSKSVRVGLTFESIMACCSLMTHNVFCQKMNINKNFISNIWAIHPKRQRILNFILFFNQSKWVVYTLSILFVYFFLQLSNIIYHWYVKSDNIAKDWVWQDNLLTH